MRISDSTVSIRAGQGVVDGALNPSERFQISNPDEVKLREFLDMFNLFGLNSPPLAAFKSLTIYLSIPRHSAAGIFIVKKISIVFR